MSSLGDTATSSQPSWSTSSTTTPQGAAFIAVERATPMRPLRSLKSRSLSPPRSIGAANLLKCAATNCVVHQEDHTAFEGAHALCCAVLIEDGQIKSCEFFSAASESDPEMAPVAAWVRTSINQLPLFPLTTTSGRPSPLKPVIPATIGLTAFLAVKIPLSASQRVKLLLPRPR